MRAKIMKALRWLVSACTDDRQHGLAGEYLGKDIT